MRNKQGRVFTKGSVVVVRFLGLSAAKMNASVKERELKVEKRVWIAQPLGSNYSLPSTRERGG